MRIGEFDVRTMKDGALFTASAAPRVKAALAGRRTAYSRGGEVLAKLPMKDGKYVGAPEMTNTTTQISLPRKSLRKRFKEEGRGRFWYENSSRKILHMTGSNVQEARKVVALLAIDVPQAKIDVNSKARLGTVRGGPADRLEDRRDER